MEFGIQIKKRKIEDVNRTSDKVGDLIDDGLTEKVYKSSIKNPKIKV